MGGGLVWIGVPAVSALGPQELAAVVAIGAILGLGFGLVELRFSHDGVLTSAGRIGCTLLGLGLGVLFVAAVAFGVSPERNIASTFVIGLPVIAGLLIATVGSGFLAASLHARSTLPLWVSVLLGCGLPVDLLLNTVGAQVLPVGFSIYGFAWVTLGYHLYDGDALRPVRDSQREMNDRSGTLFGDLSPDIIVGGMVGIVFTIVGIGGIVTGFEGLPFVGRTVLLSGLHLAIGIVGLGATFVGRRALRRYNPVAGLLLLGITIGWMFSPIREALELTLTGQVLHLPFGLLLLVTHVVTIDETTPDSTG